MTSSALALVLLSALLHALWNFLNKGSGDRRAFFLGQWLVTSVCYAPLVVWNWPASGITPIGWLWVVLTSVAHAFYALFLLKAYDAGDLSIAYPLSRTAPVLVTFWDLLTTRGVLSVGGVAGTFLAGLGAMLLQLPAIRLHGLRTVMRARVTRYALITAVFIAVFTIVDKQGVRHVPPLIYMYLLLMGESSLIALSIGRGLPGRVRAELGRAGKSMLFTGLVGPSSYLLVLWALQTSPASYVLGLRQCSIVFGVLLGYFFLGEGDLRFRLAGASVIALGSVMIAAFG